MARLRIQERVPQRVYTRDGAPWPAKRGALYTSADTTIGADTVLFAHERPRQRGMLGKAWQGDLKPVGDGVEELIGALRGVPQSKRMNALAQVILELYNASNYGGGGVLDLSDMNAGPAGALVFGVDPRERPPVATPDSINAANREFWNRDSARTSDSAWPADVSTRATPESINRANAKHWADFLGRPNPRALPSVTRDTRRPAHITPEDINAMNRDFYGSPSREQPFNREWGKG